MNPDRLISSKQAQDHSIGDLRNKLQARAKAWFKEWQGSDYCDHWTVQAVQHYGSSDEVPLGLPPRATPVVPVVIPPTNRLDRHWLALSAKLQSDKGLSQSHGPHLNAIADLWCRAFDKEEGNMEEWDARISAWLSQRESNPERDAEEIQDLLQSLDYVFGPEAAAGLTRGSKSGALNL